MVMLAPRAVPSGRVSVDNEVRDRPDRHGKILSVLRVVYQPDGRPDKVGG
jgi:hypothetical protein